MFLQLEMAYNTLTKTLCHYKHIYCYCYSKWDRIRL